MQPDWIIEMLERLDPCLYEEWDHESAKMEFDAGLDRAHAECQAFLDVLRRNPSALLGVRVIRLKVDGEQQLFLATNETYLRLSAAGCPVIEVADVVTEMDSVFSGMAILGKKRILYEGELF